MHHAPQPAPGRAGVSRRVHRRTRLRTPQGAAFVADAALSGSRRPCDRAAPPAHPRRPGETPGSLSSLQNGNRPRVVFTSSVAVFGGPLPAKVPDSTPLMPQSSYGTQKAMGELLVSDYSRRGFVDGRALRMPTISVRPGAPNKAASSFASGIIREPLDGKESVCPVAPGTVTTFKAASRPRPPRADQSRGEFACSVA